MTGETIDLTPVVNETMVREYAEKHQTQHPWDHAAGQLAALSGLAETMAELDEKLAGDELAWAFVHEFEAMHRRVSTEFARFFGETSS